VTTNLAQFNDKCLDFINKARLVYGDRFDYSRVVYVDCFQPVIIVCKKHGAFTHAPRNHLRNLGCKGCIDDDIIAKWIAKARLVHGDEYDYTLVQNSSKSTIICRTHGPFVQKLDHHLNRKCGCPRCYNDKILNIGRSFIDRAVAVHGKYQYSRTNYINNYTKVTITCPLHGDFSQAPNKHLAGSGCPLCAWRHTPQQFESKASAIHNYKYKYSGDYTTDSDQTTIVCPTHGEFSQLASNHLQGHGCPKCPTIISKPHQLILNYLDSINIQYTVNDRVRLPGVELDIYIESKNLGIEIDGAYYHSQGASGPSIPRLYHQKKHLLATKSGIRLYQFYDFNINTKTDLVLSMISNGLGLSECRLGARNCQILPIDNSVSQFFVDNHLDGHRSFKYGFGLYNGGELCSAMTFSRYRDGYEIIRYATKRNCHINGGAGKLLKHFRQHHHGPIYTYANARISIGNVYATLGFKNCGITSPGYKYFYNNSILSRQECQKKKLPELLTVYDDNLSESSNMYANGYRRIYDSGNYRFVLQ